MKEHKPFDTTGKSIMKLSKPTPINRDVMRIPIKLTSIEARYIRELGERWTCSGALREVMSIFKLNYKSYIKHVDIVLDDSPTDEEICLSITWQDYSPFYKWCKQRGYSFNTAVRTAIYFHNQISEY